MILDSYILRAAALAGYAPQLANCAICGRAGPQDHFHPPSGGLVCPACRPPGSAWLAPATGAYLVALLTGDWPATRGTDPASLAAGSGLVRAFLAWHLERSVRSLAHVERGTATDTGTYSGE
jgi:DNA repair protein RecO (recombination protein O)